MIDLVTVAEARAHLRIDDFDSGGGPDDLWLSIFIPAISEAVALWLKDDWRLYEWELDDDGNTVLDSSGDAVPAIDSNGQTTTRFAVKAAILVELERQYRFRGGESEADVQSHEGHGYTLGKGATALLSPLRKSTVA